MAGVTFAIYDDHIDRSVVGIEADQVVMKTDIADLMSVVGVKTVMPCHRR
jgi:hypothetical protein